MSQQGLSLKMSQDYDYHIKDVLFLKYVGSIVRKYRTSRNLNIEEISAMSGISNNILLDLEEGLADIYLNDLSRIATALGISAIELVDIPPAE